MSDKPVPTARIPEQTPRVSRRKLLGSLLAGGAAAVGGWLAVRPRKANAYYAGPVSDHFDGRVFFNPGGLNPNSLGQLIRFKTLERSADWPQTYPSPFQDVPPQSVGGGACRIAYIGHASFLIQTQDHNILIDPVYAGRVSPVSFLGPRRVNDPGIAFDRLPRIDTVLVTHNHYDHLDTGTLARLWASYKPRIITPLGNDAIMRADVPSIRAEPVDWGARIALGPHLEVFVEPTQHWSARGLGDRSHALWASFVLRSGDKRIYCVGDTGFGDGRTFRAVADRHAPLDLALLPIGAYEPRWFMSRQHINPDEAVQAMVLAGVKRAVGHHWGTFQLTTEPIDQPPADLAAALRRHNRPAEDFRALRPGETVEI